ncbi:MAG: flagellar hook-basal body complex protein FliE [Oscillospiraceae bacterium]
MKSLEQIGKVGQSVLGTEKTDNGGLSFQSIFKDAINDVKETDKALEFEAYRLATGQTDNLHDITIASTKASLSVELFVQLRNKALESYNEIMRMGV